MASKFERSDLDNLDVPKEITVFPSNGKVESSSKKKWYVEVAQMYIKNKSLLRL